MLWIFLKHPLVLCWPRRYLGMCRYTRTVSVVMILLHLILGRITWRWPMICPTMLIMKQKSTCQKCLSSSTILLLTMKATWSLLIIMEFTHHKNIHLVSLERNLFLLFMIMIIGLANIDWIPQHLVSEASPNLPRCTGMESASIYCDKGRKLSHIADPCISTERLHPSDWFPPGSFPSLLSRWSHWPVPEIITREGKERKTTIQAINRRADKKAKKGSFNLWMFVYLYHVDQAANAREKRRMVRMNEAVMRYFLKLFLSLNFWNSLD